MYGLIWQEKLLASGSFAECWTALMKYVTIYDDDPTVGRVARLFCLGMRLEPLPTSPPL